MRMRDRDCKKERDEENRVHRKKETEFHVEMNFYCNCLATTYYPYFSNARFPTITHFMVQQMVVVLVLQQSHLAMAILHRPSLLSLPLRLRLYPLLVPRP